MTPPLKLRGESDCLGVNAFQWEFHPFALLHGADNFGEGFKVVEV